MDRGAWQAIVHGVEESDMTEANEHAHTHSYKREGVYKGENLKITVSCMSCSLITITGAGQK